MKGYRYRFFELYDDEVPWAHPILLSDLDSLENKNMSKESSWYSVVTELCKLYKEASPQAKALSIFSCFEITPAKTQERLGRAVIKCRMSGDTKSYFTVYFNFVIDPVLGIKRSYELAVPSAFGRQSLESLSEVD